MRNVLSQCRLELWITLSEPVYLNIQACSLLSSISGKEGKKIGFQPDGCPTSWSAQFWNKIVLFFTISFINCSFQQTHSTFRTATCQTLAKNLLETSNSRYINLVPYGNCHYIPDLNLILSCLHAINGWDQLREEYQSNENIGRTTMNILTLPKLPFPRTFRKWKSSGLYLTEPSLS